MLILGDDLVSWKHPSEGYSVFKLLLKRLVEEPAEVCNYKACTTSLLMIAIILVYGFI